MTPVGGKVGLTQPSRKRERDVGGRGGEIRYSKFAKTMQSDNVKLAPSRERRLTKKTGDQRRKKKE